MEVNCNTALYIVAHAQNGVTWNSLHDEQASFWWRKKGFIWEDRYRFVEEQECDMQPITERTAGWQLLKALESSDSQLQHIFILCRGNVSAYPHIVSDFIEQIEGRGCSLHVMMLG